MAELTLPEHQKFDPTDPAQKFLTRTHHYMNMFEWPRTKKHSWWQPKSLKENDFPFQVNFAKER